MTVAADGCDEAVLTAAMLVDIFDAMAASMIAHVDELTDLDRAIGDGDHGVNMKRGFTAIAAIRDRLLSLTVPEALVLAGTTLVMTVGGASGPLYGSLFLAIGRAAEGRVTTLDAASDLVGAGVRAVEARGKARGGDKTMLETLHALLPVLGEVAAGGRTDGADPVDRLRAAAAAGAASTIPLRANRGRAAYLGERSEGHMDPGARSAQLLVEAALAALQPSRACAPEAS